jgi:hypothetical protein
MKRWRLQPDRQRGGISLCYFRPLPGSAANRRSARNRGSRRRQNARELQLACGAAPITTLIRQFRWRTNRWVALDAPILSGKLCCFSNTFLAGSGDDTTITLTENIVRFGVDYHFH